MIKDTLISKSPTERSDYKADEFTKLDYVGEHVRDDGLTIEIISVSKIDKGIEVLARAWKDGEQFGFGDGSIDIERFRIFNPPIMVEDANGNYVLSSDHNGIFVERKFREDLEEALLQTLSHTIGLVGKTGTKIIPGSIGRTTSTFYPSAGAVSPVDGYAYRSNVADVTWANARAAAGSSASATASILVMQSDHQIGENNIIYRSPCLFDTSAIPDTDAISSATFSVYVTVVQDGDSDSITVTPVTLGANDNVVASDYNIANWSDTEQVTSITMASLSTSAYNDMTVNATGLGNISKTGVTSWGLRSKHEVASTAPTIDVAISVQVSSADVAGTTQDPKLVVVHAAAGPSNLKSLDGNLKANIKSVNGNLLANIKSMDGNS